MLSSEYPLSGRLANQTEGVVVCVVVKNTDQVIPFTVESPSVGTSAM